MFAALSRMRGKRFFHPYGVPYRATISFAERGTTGFDIDLLDGSERPAIVRFSRGVGLPLPLPDVLGFAIKIPDASGWGQDQDLLMVSSGTTPIVRNLLMPARDYLSAVYSTVLPYRTRDKTIVIGARRTSDAKSDDGDGEALDGARFELLAAELGSGWTSIAVLAIGARYPDKLVDRLTFNPWNTSYDLEPVGPFNRLRRSTYEASQAARPDARSPRSSFE